MKKIDWTKRIAQLEAIVKAGKDADRKSTESKAAARAQRQLKQISAVQDLLKNLKSNARLSEATEQYIESLATEYKAGVRLDIHIGDNLVDLLTKYEAVKDLYKKILKWCDENHAQISGTEIIAK